MTISGSTFQRLRQQRRDRILITNYEAGRDPPAALGSLVKDLLVADGKGVPRCCSN